MSSPPKRNKKDKSHQDFPIDWDTNYYKTNHESEEHWNLRKSFIETYKKEFPEDRLVCLAQVFVNMEFLGCKYPTETMKLVAELSKDLAKEFREGRAKKLKRTFVTASDAAEARAKAQRSTQLQHNNFLKHTTSSNRISNNFVKEDLNSTTTIGFNLYKGLKYGKFVVYLIGGKGCLQLSAAWAQMKYKETEKKNVNGDSTIEIFLNDICIASKNGETIKSAKNEAFEMALDELQTHCFSIKPNPSRDLIKIDKKNKQIVCDITKQEDLITEDTKIDENNKGFKIMKLMGWSGGGLGAQTQGRKDPIEYLLRTDRTGIGSEPCDMDQKYFRKILTNYINSEDVRDLQFECTFSKDERMVLHKIARSLSLKSTSHGQGDQRQLIISKKNTSSDQILTEVLIKKNNGYSNKYLVQVPLVKSVMFPDHTSELKLQ